MRNTYTIIQKMPNYSEINKVPARAQHNAVDDNGMGIGPSNDNYMATWFFLFTYDR